MAFPLAALSTGISLLGSVGGLLGAFGDEKKARLAQDLAARDFNLGGEQDFTDVRGAGQRDVTGMAGTLSDALNAQRRGLYSQGAASGLYGWNPAIEGALANQASVNAATLGRYTSSLSDTLARIRNQNRQRMAEYKLGFAANDLNRAREVQAGAAGGISSILGSIGQLNLENTGANTQNPNRTVIGTGSVLQTPRIPLPPLGLGSQPVTGTGYQGGGRLTRPRFGSLSYGWS